MTQSDRQSGWTHRSEAGASEAPESPCIRRCTLDEVDLCIGCGRTLAEILEWAASSIHRKIEIRSDAAARLEQRRLRLRR